MLDIVIKNGTVIDGTGSEGKNFDIGISGEKIARLSAGIFEEAVLIINAKDHFVTPGFIDIHSHADLALLDSATSPKLMQGVTTEIIGNCGLSPSPIKEENKAEWAKLFSGVWGLYDFSWNWNSFEEYLKTLEQNPLSSNAASLAGYGAVRLKIMGMKNSAPSDEEQDALKAEITSIMESGAYGLSLGVLYPPCCYSTHQELIEASKIVKNYGGYLACHIRSEGDTLLESANEVISIAEASGVRLHISHLKSYGKKNWYKVDELLSMIEKANAGGLEVTFDQYPYTAGSTTMVALLPNWVQEGGLEPMLDLISRKEVRERIADEIREGIPGWENYGGVAGMENIVVTYAGSSKNKLPCSKLQGSPSGKFVLRHDTPQQDCGAFRSQNKNLQGKSIRQISEEEKKSEIDVICDLLISEKGVVGMALFAMDDESVAKIMKHKLGMAGSDALYGGRPHPRTYGAFPRFFSRFVKELKVLSWEESVHRMTGKPAKKLGLKDRGEIKEGASADIVIIYPQTVKDTATYEDPCRYPKGIEFVILNGKLAVSAGEATGINSGKVLRRKIKPSGNVLYVPDSL